MKFDILNRFSGNVRFSADIDCAEDAPTSIKLGLAVRVAIKKGANLQGAYLQGAYLQRAYLQRANLQRANLQGAYLQRANLQRAYLQGADLDFSCWPLCCKSKYVKADDRLVSQLLFHATRVDVSGCSGGVREAVEYLRQMAVCNLFPEYRDDVGKCGEFEAD